MADPKRAGGLTIAVMHGGPPPVRGLHEPPEEPDADDQGGPSDNDADDSGGVKPEWVHYTTEQERCHSCEHMGDDGMCSVLRMPVKPMDYCEAYEPKEAGNQVPGPEAAGGPPVGGGQ